jgi:protein-L-isoaspartate O-methyltransferase
VTIQQQQPEQAATRGLLQAVSESLGHEVAPEWQRAAAAAPRHRFLPDRIWLSRDGTYARCDRHSDPDGWFDAAYADTSVVTQVNDGSVPDDPADIWPSSSASAPSVVFRMLEALDLHPGMKVLEIGTGTGWTSALMAHRLGDANITTLEVDPALATRARAVLKEAGFTPTTVAGDGQLGWAPAAPYDRVVSTCSVRRIPLPWIAQAKPGAVILTPWDNPWLCWGLLKLTVQGDGTAVGGYQPYSAFMLMRTQRRDLRIYRDVVMDDHQPHESATTLDPWLVAGRDVDAQFAIGHRLGDAWHAWHHDPEVPGVKVRLWVATTDAQSWAAVDWDGDRDAERFTVWQHGPRRLWTEVEAAHQWWLDHGRPGPERFGLTVTPEGHRAWLDGPGNSWILPV